MPSLFEALMTIAIMFVIASVASGLFVSYREWSWRQWAKANNRTSWLLDVLLVTNIVQDVAGIWILALAMMRILGMAIPAWTAPITAILIGVLFLKKVWRHNMVVRHADRELGMFTNRDTQ